MIRLFRLFMAVLMSLVLVVPPIPARASTKAQSLITSNQYILIRIFAVKPCAPEILKRLGVVDGEFYRRATVMYFGDGKVYEACWLTVTKDGSVQIEVSNGNTYETETKNFRPERRA